MSPQQRIKAKLATEMESRIGRLFRMQEEMLTNISQEQLPQVRKERQQEQRDGRHNILNNSRQDSEE